MKPAAVLVVLVLTCLAGTACGATSAVPPSVASSVQVTHAGGLLGANLIILRLPTPAAWHRAQFRNVRLGMRVHRVESMLGLATFAIAGTIPSLAGDKLATCELWGPRNGARDAAVCTHHGVVIFIASPAPYAAVMRAVQHARPG